MNGKQKITIDQITGIIYKIKCNVTQKVYIGQTLSHHRKNGNWEIYGLEARLQKHLDRSSFSDYPLYIDIKKYGLEQFEIKIEKIIPSKDIEKLDLTEKEMIEHYNSLHPNGYNLTMNTNYMTDDKKVIYDYFKKDVERSDKYKERQLRRKQVCINCSTDKKRLEFFEDKEIESVSLIPIKEGDNYKIIRVLVYVKNFDDIFRISYSNKDIKQSIERAIEFSKLLTEKIEIHPAINNIKNNDIVNIYKYQDKLDEIKPFLNNIKRISGSYQFHKRLDKKTYLVIVYLQGVKEDDKEKKDKRYMFGGKSITEEEAYNLGNEFVQKILELKNIENVVLKK